MENGLIIELLIMCIIYQYSIYFLDQAVLTLSYLSQEVAFLANCLGLDLKLTSINLTIEFLVAPTVKQDRLQAVDKIGNKFDVLDQAVLPFAHLPSQAVTFLVHRLRPVLKSAPIRLTTEFLAATFLKHDQLQTLDIICDYLWLQNLGVAKPSELELKNK